MFKVQWFSGKLKVWGLVWVECFTLSACGPGPN